MDEERLYRLVELAHEDMLEGDTRRAKDRLRTVLHGSPHFRPALELLGRIYYQHGDYRNAVMHWSRADYWSDPMPRACEHVFRSTCRALVRENLQSARYYLYAFAGTRPPDGTKQKLSSLQNAYYRLGSKQSRLAGLACAPVSGGCLLAILALIAIFLRAGWSWFLWMGIIAGLTTVIVAAINALSYHRASRLFHTSIDEYRSDRNRR